MVKDYRRHLFFQCNFAASINYTFQNKSHEKDLFIDSNDGRAHGSHLMQ